MTKGYTTIFGIEMSNKAWMYVLVSFLVLAGGVIYLATRKVDDKKDKPSPSPIINYIVNPNINPDIFNNPNCFSDLEKCQKLTPDSDITETQRCLQYKPTLTQAECDELKDSNNYSENCSEDYLNLYNTLCKHVVNPIDNGVNKKCINPNCDPSKQECYNEVIGSKRDYYQHSFGKSGQTTDVYNGCYDDCIAGAHDTVSPCNSLCANACHNMLTRPRS